MERSTRWDNAKAILIFLVVWGHYLGTGIVYKSYEGSFWFLASGLYSFIYLFHMPMFAFISGYFSKNVDKARLQACGQLLLPYLFINALYQILSKGRGNPLFSPYGALWYLFALFLWRMLAKDVVKLRTSWLWATLFAVLCALLAPGNDYPAFCKAITFFPFFLLGLTTTPETIAKLERIPRWLCALVLLAALSLSMLLCYKGVFYEYVGFFTRLYDLENFRGKLFALDLLHFPAALVLMVCLFRLIPDRRLPITSIGRHTMPVFLLHTAPMLREAMDAVFPYKDRLIPCFFYWTMLSLLITGLLGNSAAAQCYDRFFSWLRRLLPRRVPSEKS